MQVNNLVPGDFLALRRRRGRCNGWSALEAVASLLVALLLAAVVIPLIQRCREAARGQTCREHLRQLTLALHSYHDAFGALPPAAVWSTDATVSLALHETQRIDLITHENWAILLMPHMNRPHEGPAFSPGLPVAGSEHSRLRMMRWSALNCPSDGFNRRDNHYQLRASAADEASLEFARGNYAINGGTHNSQFDPPDTSSARGDVVHLVMQERPRVYQLWGNGIAGINKSFSLAEFMNGQATLVALEELRSGVHRLDPRGVWALGQIGGSITWGHGVNGDAYRPNNKWLRSDDLLGCARLHEAVGSETLREEGMPCVDYVDRNQQATSRSLHPGGVHVAFVDGSVRFVSDQVDPGLWHVMHSRETPADVLGAAFEERLTIRDFEQEATGLPMDFVHRDSRVPRPAATRNGAALINSIGMRFVTIPAGEFLMGVPDAGNAVELPECPAQRVRLTSAFLMGVHEVTRGQYGEMIGRLPDGAPNRGGSSSPADPDDDRLPVVGVTWEEATLFCSQLSDRAEERSAARRYRLPTEAEWEYACRAGRREPYDWQPERLPGDKSGAAAGILPALPIRPVGSYPPNSFGLHDMRGNVWEWTADWFDRDYYARSPAVNPRGPADGYLKVVRGGDWRFVGEICHIDYPMLPPWKQNAMVGFRVVCETAPLSPATPAEPATIP